MWGDIVADTDRVVTSGIVNWPSHMGSFNYGYCWYMGGHQINIALYNSIPDTDVRKGWWADEDVYSDHLSALWNYFIAAYIEYPPYTQVKFAPDLDVLQQDQSANDIPLMRVEEMYLILAEATAMAGNAGQGASILTQFVQAYRDPAYTCTAGSAKDVQEAVYWQRRVELWGEGFATFDIKRLNKGVIRSYPNTNHPEGDRWNTTAPPAWMTLCIVRTETNYNSACVQNPTPIKPTADSDEYTW